MKLSTKSFITYTIAGLVLCALVLFLSKPSVEKVHEEAKAIMRDELDDGPGSNLVMVVNMRERILENKITVEDKFLFNTATFTFKGKTRTIGYGYLGFFHAK